MHRLTVTALPAFTDNYIWALSHLGETVVVDPGAAGPVLQFLEQSKTTLNAILLTHHHGDHMGGVKELVQATACKRVYASHQAHFEGITHRVSEGDAVDVLTIPFTVLEIPGHTLDHLAFWSEKASAVFCGDTLFMAGCGRVFEGTPEQMYRSLQKLAALPGQTLVYCAHEYTVSNLKFALAAEPDNAAVAERFTHCLALRAQGRASVPGLLATEWQTNPFLRCHSASVRATLQASQGVQMSPDTSDSEVFAALRNWKNRF